MMKNLLITTLIAAAMSSIASTNSLNNPEKLLGRSQPQIVYSMQSKQTLSASTRRVWIYRNDESSFSSQRIAFGVLVGPVTVQGTKGNPTEKLYELNNYEGNYYYVDLPISHESSDKMYFGQDCYEWGERTAGTVLFVNDDGTTTRNDYVDSNQNITIVQSSESVTSCWNVPSIFPFYFHGTASYLDVSQTYASTSVSVNLAAKILEGCHTCDSSDMYGYGVTSDFITNYYNKLSTTDKTTFNSTVINDIDGETTTCGNKLAMMKKNADISGASTVTAESSLNSNSSIWAIAGIAAAAIAASAIAVFAKKKKKEE